MCSFWTPGALWLDCDDSFWDLVERDARRMKGRGDEFVEADVKELARLYTWIYSCDTIPRGLPVKCTLMTDLCLDEGTVDMFESLIRHASCLETLDEDTLSSM
jgi:hypothetical protein